MCTMKHAKNNKLQVFGGFPCDEVSKATVCMHVSDACVINYYRTKQKNCSSRKTNINAKKPH